MINDEDKALQEAYDEIYNKVLQMILVKKYEPEMLAATLMAQSLKMYKLMLSEEAYIKMIEAMTVSALNMPPQINKNKLN